MNQGNDQQISGRQGKQVDTTEWVKQFQHISVSNKHATAAVNGYSIGIQKLGMVYRETSFNNAFARTS